jgi:hypothetical protein
METCFPRRYMSIRAQRAAKRSKSHSAEAFDSVASISVSLLALTLEFLTLKIHS